MTSVRPAKSCFFSRVTLDVTPERKEPAKPTPHGSQHTEFLKENGAPGRTRTSNLLIRNQVLVAIVKAP